MENNQPLEQKNIIITEVQTLDWGLKVKDEKGLVYNIPELKKGTQEKTMAYSALALLPKNGLNLNKCFKFVTVPNNQNGQSRYVRVITEPADNLGETKYVSPQAQRNVEVKVEKLDEDEKWDRINFGKCKHQFLLEILKENLRKKDITQRITPKEAEETSEIWAKMSMRILEDKKAEPKSQDEQAMEAFNVEDARGDDVDVINVPF